ncbi:hypothetical protein MMC07_002109 [Pseudocyphellaria aurata]|nr:hypothetical protein [Pseudocyphellaria aurata]
MCVQTHLYYSCGCLQSTSTTACRASLGAAKRNQPHDVTVTNISLDQPCPWGCTKSAIEAEVGGRLEENLEKTIVSTVQPPPPYFVDTASSPADIGSNSVSIPADLFSGPAGNEKVEEYYTTDAATGGTEEPRLGSKSLVMKIAYPSDIYCFTTELNTEDVRQISVVMKRRHSDNSPSRASALSKDTTSGVLKKRAPRAKKIKQKTVEPAITSEIAQPNVFDLTTEDTNEIKSSRASALSKGTPSGVTKNRASRAKTIKPKKTEKTTKPAIIFESAQLNVPDLTTEDARKISLAMQRRPEESNSSRAMQRRRSENNPSWTSGLSKGTYSGVTKERAARAKSI